MHCSICSILYDRNYYDASRATGVIYNTFIVQAAIFVNYDRNTFIVQATGWKGSLVRNNCLFLSRRQ